jgi:hypothetical protein
MERRARGAGAKWNPDHRCAESKIPRPRVAGLINGVGRNIALDGG